MCFIDLNHYKNMNENFTLMPLDITRDQCDRHDMKRDSWDRFIPCDLWNYLSRDLMHWHRKLLIQLSAKKSLKGNV